MALDINYYNQLFLDKIEKGLPVFNDAEKYGVNIEDVKGIEEGEEFWRVIGAHHLTGAENGGNHNIFIDMLDENGDRLNRAQLQLTQGSQAPVYAIVDKPTNEAGTNFPIWGETPSTVEVYLPHLPSQSVSGLRINHADEEVGNTIGHHSFYIVFQRGISIDMPPIPPVPDPDPDPVPPQARVGGILVTVNVDWINSLKKDSAGNVTFFVDVYESPR